MRTCNAVSSSLVCTLGVDHRGRHYDAIRGAHFWSAGDVPRLDAEARTDGSGYTATTHGSVLDAVAPSGRRVQRVVTRRSGRR